MMAVPKAFQNFGVVAGGALIVGVAALTYWTKAVMVEASHKTGATSYTSLVETQLGKPAGALLQLATMGFCFGCMVLYLVIVADLLVGQPAGSGMLADVLPRALSGSGWATSRPAVLTAVSTLVCAPLLALRSMETLAPFNTLGVLATVVMAATIGLLGLAAVGSGQAAPLPLLPQWSAFGDSPVRVAAGMAATAPVVLCAYVGHQSLHQLMPLLRPYTPARMSAVVATAMASCVGIYLAVALGGVAAFGAALDGNVLTNMSTSGMGRLLGSGVAQVLNLVVRGGYLISLLGGFALFAFPMREVVAQVLWGSDAAAKLDINFYPLTYGLLLAMTGCAILVPNIWAVLGLIGNLACTVVAFIMPGLIALRLKVGGAGGAAFATTVVALGGALFTNGLIQQFV